MPARARPHTNVHRSDRQVGIDTHKRKRRLPTEREREREMHNSPSHSVSFKPDDARKAIFGAVFLFGFSGHCWPETGVVNYELH